MSLFFVYSRTMAPGLSWANNGSDGGDLIAAAATGGIAHPTGYPLYLLLAPLFQLLPLGSLAFRTNLMSATMTAAAAVLVYLVVVRFFEPAQRGHAWPAGLVAGYAFGLAPLVWSQAVITEVYALQALSLTIVLAVYTGGASRSRDRSSGFFLGLATGSHLTTLLLAPVVLLAQPGNAVGGGPPRAFDYRSLGRGVLFFLLGLTIYLILPLRAMSRPVINWGDASTLHGFWWLVSGRLYAENLDPTSGAQLVTWLQDWAALMVEQWSPGGLLLACFGLVYFFSPSRLYLFTIWQALVFSAFSIVYASNDSSVYLLPVCISFSIWMGVGLGRILHARWVHDRRLAIPVFLLALLSLAALAAYHLPRVDASTDGRAERFGEQVLAAAPSRAMVFARGDQAVFALWYFHFALNRRPDLTVIAADLLHFDWYVESLARHYPALRISDPFPWPETLIYDNPGRAFCYVEYAEEIIMDCAEPPPGE